MFYYQNIIKLCMILEFYHFNLRGSSLLFKKKIYELVVAYNIILKNLNEFSFNR